MLIQTDKLMHSKREQKDQEALKKVLHNGYTSEQERVSAGNLPGSKIRKRYSVGMSYVVVLRSINLSVDIQFVIEEFYTIDYKLLVFKEFYC